MKTMTILAALLIFPYQTIAHSSIFFPFKSSLGQLCKTADFVAKGTIIKIEDENTSPVNIVTFNVTKVIVGEFKTDSNKQFKVSIENAHDLNVNDDYLFFASQKYFPLSEGSKANFDQFRFDFRREDAGVKLNTLSDHDWFIIGDSRGIFLLEPKEEINPLLEVIKGYWGHLRGTERDRDKYEHFLKGLLESDNNRVKSDADLDFRLLIRLSDVDDLKRLGVDEELTFELRTYALEILDWRLGESD